MKCVRITTIMKMGVAAVLSIAMNTVTSAGMTKRAAAAKFILMKGMNTMPAAVKNMSTIITAVVVGKNTITNISMAKVVVVGNIITMSMMIAAAADMNIITATMFRGTRRTAGAKYAIRTKNTVTCAAKVLKTAPAVCRTLTA